MKVYSNIQIPGKMSALPENKPGLNHFPFTANMTGILLELISFK